MMRLTLAMGRKRSCSFVGLLQGFLPAMNEGVQERERDKGIADDISEGGGLGTSVYKAEDGEDERAKKERIGKVALMQTEN